MLIVDASCLYEVLVSGPRAAAVISTLAEDQQWAAPHCIEAEVLGVLRRDWSRGVVDEMTCGLAVRDLRAWPGYRIPHTHLVERAWQLRHQLRSWDALYVALAQHLDAPLVTLDSRLARAADCEVLIPGSV